MLMRHKGDTKLYLLLTAHVILLGSSVLPMVRAAYDSLHGLSVSPCQFPTSYPLSTITNRPNVACGETSSRSASTRPTSGSTLGKRQMSNGGDERTPKRPRRGRSNVYHPEISQCNPCALWQQSGADQNVLHLHPQHNMRHAGSDARDIENYACWDGTCFQLDHDSCICKPCHQDYNRNISNRENRIMPRWAKKQTEFYRNTTIRHCLLCCEQESEHEHCRCSHIAQWGPDQWNGLDQQSTWIKFLCVTGYADPTVAEMAKHICRAHYRRIIDIRGSRSCQICSTNYSDSTWKLVSDVTNNPDSLCKAFSLPAGSVNLLGWICSRCELCNDDMYKLCTRLEEDISSDDIIISTRARILHNMVEKLRTEGIVFTRDVHTEFKFLLKQSNIIPGNKLINSFTKYIDSVAKKNSFCTYIPSTSTLQMGKVVYNDKVFNSASIPSVFKLKIALWKALSELEDLKTSFSSCMTAEKLRQLIKEQASKFPKSRTFDYRTLTSGRMTMDESIMDAYFNPQLVDFLDEATTSEHSLSHGNQMSSRYRDLRRLRIRMTIALLCVTRNPATCFFQTLLGLMCYAYGLRDRGFELLNAFGCTCSAEHIREHGTFWANKRNVLEELDCNRPWRVSIDNLNFNIKFAKTLQAGSSGAKKMLNLITGQVSTRIAEARSIRLHHTLRDLVHHTLASCSRNATTLPLTETDFLVDSKGERDPYLDLFVSACFVSAIGRLHTSPVECQSTFMESLRDYLPHWTPSSPDNVVYTTIQEALSGSISDIETYLMKLKQDLKIGHPGYPTYVVIAGDQQTYALMKKLHSKYPQLFKWIIITPGDWHLLKLTSELLRDLMWDGGFRQLCYECGHKKQPTQWQEIHMLLVATYETLLRKAILEYANRVGEDDTNILQHHAQAFWEWIHLVGSSHNQDQVSCFWAITLIQLNSYLGYYFAIRSGNWHLRNSCLKAILPLFFAYCRDKYEELSTTALMDTYNFPAHIQDLFLAGQWTVSQRGKPYHNIALDEAHECIINLRLKAITARPSHFRTVELADFLSYLDTIVHSLKAFLHHYRASPSEQRKRYICQRTTRMIPLLEDVTLFRTSTEEVTQLSNIFDSTPKQLDSSCIHDLLTFQTVGADRLVTYVKQYILPTTEPDSRPEQLTDPDSRRKQPKKDTVSRPKRRKRLRKLCTFSSRPAPAREQKRRVNELENIARNAMQILQDHGITEQTSPYPLALADIHGNMRVGTKSNFLPTLKAHSHFLPAFQDTCPLLSQLSSHRDVSDVCVIVDFLYFIHIPPTPDIVSFYDFFTSLWARIVQKYAIHHQCKRIYIVIDKPEYLPPPRLLVHQSRSKRSGSYAGPTPKITDSATIPHGKNYTALLSSATFKADLLDYLTKQFITHSVQVTKTYPFHLLLGSPSIPVPALVSNGLVTEQHPNKHGEADYAIWYHTIHTPSQHIVIVSSDTDTWVYGLGLAEVGWLQGKQVFVKRGNADSFININLAAQLITTHPSFRNINHPVSSLVALYVLTGCDYLSSFYRCIKRNFLDAFLENTEFITKHVGSLVSIADDKFKAVNEQAWIRLVTAIYFIKHKVFFRRKPIKDVYNNLINFPDAPESQRMFRILGYTQSHKISSLVDWHAFIRKVTFHDGKVTRFHEAKLIPSWSALIQHCNRGNYVLKLVYSSPVSQCTELRRYNHYGWQQTEQSTIEVVWEQADPQEVDATDDDSVSSEDSGPDSDSDADTDRDNSDNEVNVNGEQQNQLSYGSDSDSEL